MLTYCVDIDQMVCSKMKYYTSEELTQVVIGQLLGLDYPTQSLTYLTQNCERLALMHSWLRTFRLAVRQPTCCALLKFDAKKCLELILKFRILRSCQGLAETKAVICAVGIATLEDIVNIWYKRRFKL